MIRTNHHRTVRSFTKIFSALALGFFGASAFGEEDSDSGKLAQFSQDHKSIVVEAPGIEELVFGTGVIFKVDGTRETLSSDRTPLLSSTGWTTVETPMGMAEATSAAFGCHGADSSCRRRMAPKRSPRVASQQLRRSAARSVRRTGRSTAQRSLVQRLARGARRAQHS